MKCKNIPNNIHLLCSSYRIKFIFNISLQLPLPNGVPRHYTQCCGRTATYDRRFDSCPCDDGTIVNVTAPNSACCETPEGLKTPYTRDIELCCPNGRVNFIYYKTITPVFTWKFISKAGFYIVRHYALGPFILGQN